MSTLVNVKDLSVSYFTYAGEVQSVRGVSFEIEKGKTTTTKIFLRHRFKNGPRRCWSWSASRTRRPV